MAVAAGAEGTVDRTSIGLDLVFEMGDGGMVGDAAGGAVEGCQDVFREGRWMTVYYGRIVEKACLVFAAVMRKS
jgi:hypothetical protein